MPAPFSRARGNSSSQAARSRVAITNNIYHAAPTIPSDFRRIPWADIDLRHPIRLESKSGVAYRERGHGVVRRMYYQAKIEGRESDLTVAVYEGHNSEEEWRQEVTKYSHLRHPNILQIFGAASSSGMHAIIANDDLVPLLELLKLYHQSPILTVYIYNLYDPDWMAAYQYMVSKFQAAPSSEDCTMWIRRSTNRLCVELSINEIQEPVWLSIAEFQSKLHNDVFNLQNQETKLINSLELDHYHMLCYLHLRKDRKFLVSGAEGGFNAGAVMCCPAGSQIESSAKIAVLANTKIHIMGWFLDGLAEESTKDGWTRFDCDEVFGRKITCGVGDFAKYWLTQANSVFTQLRIISNHEDYVVIAEFYFRLEVSCPVDFIGEVSRPVQHPLQGYLFVCPVADFRTGPTTFRWPSCPAYWSLDPSGVERLSADEAEHLAFPSINFTAGVRGCDWDSSVYAGLRKFHQGKGLDPDSQDVARHLGVPLYRLFSEIKIPLLRTWMTKFLTKR